jgi:hypothetical protein
MRWLFYLLNPGITFTSVYLSVEYHWWIFIPGSMLLAGNLCVVFKLDAFQSTQQELDMQQWREEFSKTHTFLYTRKDDDDEVADLHYWRNNDTWEIVKQWEGHKL